MKWVYAQSLLFSINGRAFTDKTGHLRKKFSLFRGGNLKNKNKKKNKQTNKILEEYSTYDIKIS